METTGVVNANRRKRGNFSPWQPKHIRSTYLLDSKPKSPAVGASLFFRRIRNALEWVVGDIVDIFELEPARAYQLEHCYGGRRLTTTRGLGYAQQRRASDSKKIEADPFLFVERKAIDGKIEPLDINPAELIGALNEQGGSCVRDPIPEICPNCGIPMVDICEEDDRRFPEGGSHL